MKVKFKKIMATLTILSALYVPLVMPNTSYAKDTRPIVIEYKTDEGKNLHRLKENSVQILDINGWHLISAQTTHLTDVGFDWFGIAKSSQFRRHGTYFWLFKPIAEGKSQFNGWIIKDKENIDAACNDLLGFYSALDTDTVTDPSRVKDGCTDIEIYKSINKYIWEKYPEMCREAIAYNEKHEEELVKIREAKEAEEAKREQDKINKEFSSVYGKAPASYISINEEFSWSDFLINGITPEIDVNWLIHNLWYVEYTEYGKKYSFIARFIPFIWLNLGENKETLKTLVLTDIYDKEKFGGKGCSYMAQAGDYDGKQVTFDDANFIVDMNSKGVPETDNGDVYTINSVDMNGSGFATRLVMPLPMIFLKSSSKPEWFKMEQSGFPGGEKIIYKFTRMN